MTRMRGHIADGPAIDCVAIADAQGERIAQAASEDASRYPEGPKVE